MEDKPTFPSPLYIGLIIFLGFIFSIASAAILSAVSFAVFPALETSLQGQRLLAKVIITVGELNLFLFAVFFLYRRMPNLTELFRIHRTPTRPLLLMLPMGIALSIAGDALDRLIQIVIPSSDITEQLATMLKATSSLELMILILGSVIVAPLVEEWLFRGALQQAFERTIGVTKGVIYASLLWAIIHGIMNWAVQIFVLGVIIGYVAWRMNSTLPTIILHAINNMIAVMFYNWNLPAHLPAYEWQNQVNPIYTVMAVVIIYGSIRWLDGYYRSSNSAMEP